jgi:hypothetical protein
MESFSLRVLCELRALLCQKSFSNSKRTLDNLYRYVSRMESM